MHNKTHLLSIQLLDTLGKNHPFSRVKKPQLMQTDTRDALRHAHRPTAAALYTKLDAKCC